MNLTGASFPTTRMRRNRRTEWSRRLVQENDLSVNDLIWPIFVQENGEEKTPVASMPGAFRYNVKGAVKAVEEAARLGIPVVAVFPHVEQERKDPHGNYAIAPDNHVCRTVRAIKQEAIEIGVMCDAALDPFTSHGHDGVLVDDEIANDASVEILVKQALIQAEAGCDIISPSDMMDGRIGSIRTALDEHGFNHVQIMSYAAKYASCFYGPFRDAIGSKGALGKASKSTYQMNSANTDEALREVALDIQEGADMVMVKPGMPYLDVLHRVKAEFGMPTFAYQVSGEYAMIQAASGNGWLDGERAMLESLLCFKRAGADGILTYFAPEVARRLKDQS